MLDGTTVSHVYDIDGNRVQTKVTPAGGGTPTVTNYLVDTTGNVSQVVAETDGAGALKALYARAYDELLAVLRPTGTTTWASRFVHSDGLGSVRVLTDEAGNVTDTRGYEAFGVSNATTGSDSLAFGFAGEQYDSLAKLAYHRARWMDSRTGRFVGMDPKDATLQRPGMFHLFVYAGNSPISNFDPNGQEFSMASAGATVAIIGNLATAALGAYRITTSQVPISLQEIRQTATMDLLVLAMRIVPVAAIPMEVSVLNRAKGIVQEREGQDPTMAFEALSGLRNSSYEQSQDLALAAAEHFFYTKSAMQESSNLQSAVQIIRVFGYDGLKAVSTPLAIGLGRYAWSAKGSTYPASPPTLASVVCGLWGILDGTKESNRQ